MQIQIHTNTLLSSNFIHFHWFSYTSIHVQSFSSAALIMLSWHHISDWWSNSNVSSFENWVFNGFCSCLEWWWMMIIGGLDCPPSSIPWDPGGLQSLIQSLWSVNPTITWPLLFGVYPPFSVLLPLHMKRPGVKCWQQNGGKGVIIRECGLMVVFVVEIYSCSLCGEQFVSRQGTLDNPGLWQPVPSSPF